MERKQKTENRKQKTKNETNINIRKHIIHTIPKHLLQKGMP